MAEMTCRQLGVINDEMCESKSPGHDANDANDTKKKVLVWRGNMGFTLGYKVLFSPVIRFGDIRRHGDIGGVG